MAKWHTSALVAIVRNHPEALAARGSGRIVHCMVGDGERGLVAIRAVDIGAPPGLFEATGITPCQTANERAIAHKRLASTIARVKAGIVKHKVPLLLKYGEVRRAP